MTEEIYPMPSFATRVVREVTVIDPDGYRLVFSVPIDIGLGFDQVIE